MNLFVGNLSPETSRDDLVRLFSEFGRILNSKIIKDPETGESRKFGFVEMSDKFEAFDAIDNLDMTYFQGTVISVTKAHGKTSDTSAQVKKPFHGNKYNRKDNG